MNNYRLIFAFLIILCPLLHVKSQGEKDIVIQAAQNTLNLDSYQISVETEFSQEFISGLGLDRTHINFEVFQNGSGYVRVVDGELEMDFHLDQNGSMDYAGDDFDITMNADVILTDNALYIHFTDVSENLASLVPNDWFNVNENTEEFPGSRFLNVATFISLARGETLYLLQEESIETITELKSESIDGQETRVFEVTLDSEAVMETNQSFMPNLLSELNTDPSVIWDALAEGSNISMKVWIGDDDIIQRIEYIASSSFDLGIGEFSSGSVSVTQAGRSTVRLSAFNDPVEIEIPQIDSGFDA